MIAALIALSTSSNEIAPTIFSGPARKIFLLDSEDRDGYRPERGQAPEDVERVHPGRTLSERRASARMRGGDWGRGSRVVAAARGGAAARARRVAAAAVPVRDDSSAAGSGSA
jgi:hypothetical protein